MNNLLEVSSLCKDYRNFSLKNVSFSLPGGAVMGFIGANGAGKTTTIKAILGALHRQGGRVQLFGQDFNGEDLALREKIGVVMDQPFYVEEWPISALEKNVSPFYKNWDSKCFHGCLTRFHLDPKKRIKELSRGMKVKLMIAVALSHHAELLMLDEPTSGLDPVARDELMDVLREFTCDEQHSILFSTHITSDLEKIADYITFLQHGTVIFTGERDDLLEKYCIIRGGHGELTPKLRQDIIGLREHGVGFEGLLPSQGLRFLPQGVVTEPCTLEEIMIFMNKEAV